MALTKVSRGLLSTGIVDNSNATAITLNADESATFAAPLQLTAGALAAAGNAGLSHRSADNKVYLQAGTGGFNILDDQQNTHFAIDSAGVSSFNNNVGIGGNSTGYKLHVFGDESMIRMQNTGSGTNGFLDFNVTSTLATINANYSSSAIPLRFMTGATERVRITGGDGHFLVGNTVTNPSSGFNNQKGFAYAATTGQVQIATNANNAVLELGKNEQNDGDLIVLRKQSSQSGSIAINSTRVLIQSSGASGLRFDATALVPFLSGSQSNGGVDLGASSAALKDGYLAGNLFVGTTSVLTHGVFNMSFDGTNKNALSLKTTRSATGSNFAIFLNSSGSIAGLITQNGSTTVNYGSSSDRRLKSGIKDAPSASDDIDAIQVRSFNWKADGEHEKYGFIAQELELIAPKAVSKMGTPDEEDPMLGVDPSKLVPMMVKEIQSLRARVAQLEQN